MIVAQLRGNVRYPYSTIHFINLCLVRLLFDDF